MRLPPRAISGRIAMCMFDPGMVPMSQLQNLRDMPQARSAEGR